jgi:hypothetical protein
MEVVMAAPAPHLADEVTTLLNAYEALSDEYTLQAARKQVLDNLIMGKIDASSDPVAVSNAVALREAFLAKTRELASEVLNLQDACLTVEETDDAHSDAHLRAEIARGEELLKKLVEESQAVDATLAETRRQIEDLNNSDELDAKENRAPDSELQAATAAALVNVDLTKLNSVQKTHKESSALFAGLSTLTGVKEFRVSESAEDGEGAVAITATIGKCTVEVVLGAEDKRVSAIELKSGDLPMRLEKLMDDSRVLPSPQDLRYVVFAIGAAQGARDAAARDIAAVKALRTCLFKALPDAPNDTALMRFQLELKGRIVAVVAVHECYPDVPSGVLVHSLTGPDGTPEEAAALAEVRNATNALCFRTIPDMYMYLTGPKALGKL